jgi:phage shock protein A
MGIFDRLSTLIRSNINELISRAENPEKMLNQLIVDMRSQLAKAKQQVAAAIADEKRLAAQVDQEKKSVDWSAGRCWRCRRGATTWPSRRCCGTTSTRRAPCSCTTPG